MAARKAKGLSRAEELREVGLAAYQACPAGASPQEALIDAVAVMLAQAEVQRKRGTVKVLDEAKLPFSPGEFYNTLRAQVGDKVVCEPVEHRLFGMLGGRMKAVLGLQPGDCQLVVSWIDAGGLANWSVMPTFAHVVQNFPKFVAYAREWQRRGRQELGRGKLNVGHAVSGATDEELGGEFR